MAQKQPQKIDDTGWIKLHRKIQLNPLWTERRRFSRAEAWIDILMEARHDPEPARLLIGNKIIECKRGECIKSLDTWANRWKWNKSAVRRFFDLLQGMNQIRHENETKTTRLCVCNYETYNGTRRENETEMKRKRNADETHLTPNKNDNTEENVKNEEDPLGLQVEDPSISQHKPRARNLLADALSTCEGGPSGITRPTWKKIGSALADIRAASPDVTPDEILRRIANYRTHMPDCQCTATAMANHWATCATAKQAAKAKNAEHSSTIWLDQSENRRIPTF